MNRSIRDQHVLCRELTLDTKYMRIVEVWRSFETVLYCVRYWWRIVLDLMDTTTRVDTQKLAVITWRLEDSGRYSTSVEHGEIIGI